MVHVVFIDDEHGPIDYYVTALKKSGHTVDQLDTVEKLFAYLDSNQKPDIYVVDIMMPTHGDPRLKDAADGLASGVVLHRAIRRYDPRAPIVLLTSIYNPDILEALPLEPHTQVKSKIDMLPFELAALVSSLVSKPAK